MAKQAVHRTRVILMMTSIILASHGGSSAKMLSPFKCYLGGIKSDG